MLELEEQYLCLTIKYLMLILAVPSMCSITGKAACLSGLWHAHSTLRLGSGFLYTGASTGLQTKPEKSPQGRTNNQKKTNYLTETISRQS